MKNAGTLASHHAQRPRDRDDARLRRAAPPGLRRLHQARAAQALAVGPRGWSLPVCEIDLRVGGAYRYVWRGPTASEMGMGGVYREIVPPERIVSTESSTRPGTGGEALDTLVLVEQGGKTTLTQHGALRVEGGPRRRPQVRHGAGRGGELRPARRGAGGAGVALTRDWHAARRRDAATAPTPIASEVQAALACARAPEHRARPRRTGALRHHRGQGVRRVDGQHAGAGEAPRARPRARRRALGDRLVRGPHAGRVRRRAGARHARADGPLVPRLRQLGHLRHGLLPPVRPHAARLGARSRSGRAGATSSSSARPSRCWRASPLHDKQRRRRAVRSQACRSIERAAADERNFVKKAVNWALRAIGKRNAALHAAAVAVARRLAASPAATPRWVGKDALRELTQPQGH